MRRNSNFPNKNTIPAVSAAVLLAALAGETVLAQTNAPSSEAAPRAALPPAPAPMAVPAPGPATDQPYAPQPILQGGVVVTLFPPDSPYLNKERIREPEKYSMSRSTPGRIQSIVNIHNPSIEFHGGGNTGTTVILAAGGGHATLNVGPESADFVPFFYNYGVNTVILRNRLRRDGYNPQTDEVYDALQAIRMVRARAKEWRLDPNRIGIIGFSAGAELSAPAAVQFNDFDQKNNDPADPLAGVTCRPDFVGLLYPGPSPFTRDPETKIPRNAPPAFIACAGSGDQIHAIWADDYFSAMLRFGVPNLDMHIYANGGHAGGLTDRNGTPFGTWQDRFIDWFRDLGFLQKSGVETKAAKDSAAFVTQPPRRGGRGGRGRRGGPGGPGGAAAPASPGGPAAATATGASGNIPQPSAAPKP